MPEYMSRKNRKKPTANASPGVAFSAAADVLLPPPSKVKSTPTSIPSFLTTAKPSQDSFLPQSDLRLASIDLETLRTGATTPATLRTFVKASPDLSAAIFADVRLAVSPGYTVLARNLDGTLNVDGTKLVQQLCQRFDLLGPTTGGFNVFPSLRSAAESIGREFMIGGGGALELVTNASRLPEGIRPITVEGLRWKYNGKRQVPYQVVSGEEINLDIPTFFYVALDQDLKTPYCESPIQSALPAVLAAQTFVQDLRRVFRRSISPRIRATIVEEAFRKSVPIGIAHDPKALKDFTDAAVAQIQTMLNGLAPDDALVLFDTLEVDYMNNGSTSLSDEYKTLFSIINAQLSSGAKTLPVILGQAGTSNVASTESMLKIKSVEGAVQAKLNELFSRMLTLCVRLFGVDAVAKFSWDAINLRPEAELEAFKAMKQSRVLQQLSLGLIDDNEASIMTTGTLPPLGYVPLTGTGFMNATPAQATDQPANPDANANALNRDLNSSAPKNPKSANGGQAGN